MSYAIITKDSLLHFTREVLVAFGMPPDDAALEADLLVWANTRGVDSHGVLRLPRYLEHIREGRTNPRPDIRVTKETAASCVIEADRALGAVPTVLGMRKAIAKASDMGIAWCLIRDSGHQGAIGYFSLMAAREDMIGLSAVSTVRNMVPYGARAAGISNCPLAIAVPTTRYGTLLLDMATSIAAGGKIKLAVDKGIPIPDDWALDASGSPTTDPSEAVSFLPFGGYKGSGLSIMIECLTSLLVDNSLLGYGDSPEPSYSGRSNGFVAAIDLCKYTDVVAYKRRVDAFIDNIRALPTAEGCSEVLFPNEPESRVEAQRLREGIPLPEGTVRNLREVAAELGVPLPSELA